MRPPRALLGTPNRWGAIDKANRIIQPSNPPPAGIEKHRTYQEKDLTEGSLKVEAGAIL